MNIHPNQVEEDFKSFPQMDPAISEKMAKEEAKQAEAERKLSERLYREQQKAAKKLEEETKKTVKKARDDDSKALKQRRINLNKIKNYKEKLGHKLTVKIPRFSESTSNEKIQDIVNEIEDDLAASSSLDVMEHLYLQAINGTVDFCKANPQFGIKLEGPNANLGAAVASNRDKWQDIVTELNIKYGHWFSAGPVARLAFVTVNIAVAVHRINTMNLQKLQEDVPEDIAQEAEGL